MRPAGEITMALLDAARALRTDERAPTMAELAAHAQVGYDAANNTVKNLKRRGRLRIVRTRRVDYVNKPVHEYEPVEATQGADGAGWVDLGQALGVWR